MEIDITQIVVAIIGLMSVVITCIVAPFIKSKLTQNQWNMLMEYALAGVQAAEIIIGSGRGEEKLQWVTDYIIEQCRIHGMKIDMDSVRVAIENAWKELGLDKKQEA